MQDHSVAIDRSAKPSGLAFAPNFNVAVAFVDRHLKEGRGAKVAVRTHAGRDVSYAELARETNRTGNALKALGLKQGDRVLMMVKDCPEFIFLFWGAIKAGFVPVQLNTLLRAPDYRYMIEDSGAALVVYSPEFAAEVEPALAQAERRPAHAPRTEGNGTTLLSLAEVAADTLAPAPAKATDDCFWLYSSGSTGRPKGAVHAHRDMVVSSQYYGVETLGVLESDVCFSAAKLFFAYGLGNAMTFPLWVGATAVLFDQRPTPDSTFATVERFRPTLYFGVPTLYAAQLQALEKGKRDFSSIRYCVSAGEALPANVFLRWKELTGLIILDGIGSTEALHIFISNRPGDATPGTSGRPVAGYEAKIVDDQGKVLCPGQSGRLVIKGLSSAKYYWNNAARTAQTMRADGWLDTGDTYEQDASGRYVYCGRSDDMMKVGGIWCSPFEIEAKLIEHPKVLEAAVVGHQDPDGLIKPEAWIVLKSATDASDALKEDILRHVKSGLAPYKYPRWINFATELPKTATGKIQRFKLRQG